MTTLQALVLTLVGFVATLVVLARDTTRQAMLLSLFGLTLAVLFFVLQAPDVALSQIVVGIVALPLLILLALAKLRQPPRAHTPRR